MADGSPDWQTSTRHKYWTAVACLDDVFRERGVGGRLPSKVLARYDGEKFVTGWRVHLAMPDVSMFEFHVLVDQDFPYSAPRIAVPSAPRAPQWPHLEREGLLCILPADASVSSETPADVVDALLEDARRLVGECLHGSNINDFCDEFASYWGLTTDGGEDRFVSILDPTAASRIVKVWRGAGFRVFGEDATTLGQWLKDWEPVAVSGSDILLHDAALLWLPRPLLPTEYPNNAAEVRELSQDGHTCETIDTLVTSTDDDVEVLIGARTPNGICYGGITIPTPRRSSVSRAGRTTVHDGFRRGRTPRHVHVQRRLGRNTTVRRAKVQRADHCWVHGRDRDERQDRLRSSRVAVLGCGALGGMVARLLAQSGVGNLLLVDSATLDWPNLSRHVLGAASLHKNKATALANELRRALPHLGKVEAKAEDVSPCATELIDECSSCDLIVSTMGNWAAEAFLSDVQRQTPNFPPIVFGWLEAYAIAAHAVSIPQGAACLRCGMSETGRPNLRVATWSGGDDTAQEPACGAVFTPYGPIALGWAQTLVAECALSNLDAPVADAIHRIWVASRKQLAASKGTWSPEWERAFGDSEGGRTVESRWPRACPFCLQLPKLRIAGDAP